MNDDDMLGSVVALMCLMVWAVILIAVIQGAITRWAA